MENRRFRLAASCVFAAAFAGLFSFLFYAGVFDHAELNFLDFKMGLRGTRPALEKIVILAIDDESEEKLGSHIDPPSRIFMARAVTNLSDAGADVIALDYRFARDPAQAEASEELRASFEDAANVVLPIYYKRGKQFTSDRVFSNEAMAEGMINVRKDGDGVLRRIYYTRTRTLAKEKGGADEFHFAFPAEILRVHKNIGGFPNSFMDEADGLHMNVIPEEGENAGKVIATYVLPEPLIIEYAGPAGHFKRIPFWRAVKGNLGDEVDGKIVLVGDVRQTAGDVFDTPFSKTVKRTLEGFETWEYSSTPGIEIHANVLQTLIESAGQGHTPITYRYDVPAGLSVLVYWLLAAAFTFFFLYLRIPVLMGVAVFVLIEAGTFGASQWLFSFTVRPLGVPGNIAFPTVPVFFLAGAVFLGATLFKWVLETRRTRMIKEMFGKYLSKNIMEKVLKGEIHIDLKGRKKELTVLFSDIRGFTSVSEDLGAEEVSELLNSFFSRMLAEIFETEGTLDKLMGDCIMAFWNDPEEQPAHPALAARCALRMIAALKEFRNTSPLAGASKLNIGVGINTGEATVGNLGSPDYFDYTALGDSVNLASRLEGINKYYNTNIIVNASTWERIRDEFEAREVDVVIVKGKTEPIRIYELICEKKNMDEKTTANLDAYNKAYGLWRGKDWSGALAAFRQYDEKFGPDPVAGLYIGRLEEFNAHPPASDWDGVTVMDRK